MVAILLRVQFRQKRSILQPLLDQVGDGEIIHSSSPRSPHHGSHKKNRVTLKDTLIVVKGSNLEKSQGRKLLSQCQASRKAKDGQWGEARQRQRWENYPGCGISKRRGRDEARKGAARSKMVRYVYPFFQ